MSELDKHITLENFERLYSEYKPRFIIIARSYIRNNMAAEDIVTDSFLYFWENKDKLNITTTIQAYILGSVKHGCLEWLRNQKNRLKIQQQIHTTAYRSIKAKITVLESTNPEASFTAEIKSSNKYIRRLTAASKPKSPFWKVPTPKHPLRQK